MSGCISPRPKQHRGNKPPYHRCHRRFRTFMPLHRLCALLLLQAACFSICAGAPCSSTGCSGRATTFWGWCSLPHWMDLGPGTGGNIVSAGPAFSSSAHEQQQEQQQHPESLPAALASSVCVGRTMTQASATQPGRSAAEGGAPVSVPLPLQPQQQQQPSPAPASAQLPLQLSPQGNGKAVALPSQGELAAAWLDGQLCAPGFGRVHWYTGTCLLSPHAPLPLTAP